jgi:hypothetical protein
LPSIADEVVARHARDAAQFAADDTLAAAALSPIAINGAARAE